MSTLKINTITAFIATDSEGNEGIMGFKGEDEWLSMIGADENRITSLFPIANEMSKLSGMPYKIVRFTTMTDITEEVTSKYSEHE